MERLPWILLVISWIYFQSPKDTLKRILEQPKLPWILVLISWGYIAIPQELRKKLLLFGAKPKRHTAKFIPRIPAPKITELSSQPSSQVELDQVQQKTKRVLTEMHIDELLQELQPQMNELPKPHKFAKEANLGIVLMDRVCPLDDWQVQQENSGIQISVLPVDGLSLPFIRGDGFIPGTFSTEEVLSVIQNPFARKFWDPRFDSAQVLEFLSSTDVLVYSVQKGTFPVAARDLVTVTSVRFKDNVLDYTVSSCKDDKAPSPGTGGKVRAELMLAGWRLTKTETGVHASYIVHVDAKGSIPAAIIRSVQAQTPMCIKGVADFITQKGCLPYQLLGKYAPTPDITSTNKEATHTKCMIEYTLNPVSVGADEKQGSFYLGLPNGPFSTGCEIKIETKGTCEFHARLVPRSELGDTISAATGQVIHIWSTVKDTVSVTMVATPSTKHTLNGTQIV